MQIAVNFCEATDTIDQVGVMTKVLRDLRSRRTLPRLYLLKMVVDDGATGDAGIETALIAMRRG